MATRFTRLSVVAGRQQLDASLPGSRPVAEFLPDLPGLFSLPTTSPPTVWALSTPRHGLIPPERSLDEVGVLDGDVLYLSPTVAAAESPVVDDVLTAVAENVERRALPWSGAYRDRVTTCLVGLFMLAGVGVLATVPDPWLSGMVLVLACAGAVGAAVLLRSRGGRVLGWVGVPAAALAMLRLAGGAPVSVRVAGAVAGGLVAAALAVGAGRHARVVGVAAAAGGLIAGGVALLLASGVGGSAVAGWSVPLLVLAAGVLPQLALSASGLLGLVQRAEEAAQPVNRREVTRAVRVGRATINGLLTAVAVGAATAAATLVWAGRPSQAVLGGLLGLVFLLRSRGFAEAYQVGCMLTVPVAALIAAAAALPLWLDIAEPGPRAVARVVAVAAATAAVAVPGYVQVSEVTAARLSRLWDRIDTIAVLAVVPMVLVAQNVFAHIAGTR